LVTIIVTNKSDGSSVLQSSSASSKTSVYIGVGVGIGAFILILCIIGNVTYKSTQIFSVALYLLRKRKSHSKKDAEVTSDETVPLQSISSTSPSSTQFQGNTLPIYISHSQANTSKTSK
jgi:hypothetical protein